MCLVKVLDEIGLKLERGPTNKGLLQLLKCIFVVVTHAKTKKTINRYINFKSVAAIAKTIPDAVSKAMLPSLF